MTFDLVYKEIGDLGWYQKRVLLLSFLTDVYGGFIFINSVFLLYIPDHRCVIPGYENDTYTVQDDTHAYLINSTIPRSSHGTSTFDKCHIYARDSNGTTEIGADSRITKCNSWVYDPSVYTNTIGIQMNLVCDRTILKSSAQMAFFIGYFIGSFTSGIISDKFGRKFTTCTSIILLTLVCLSIAWTPSIEVYLIQSAGVGCFYVSMFQPIYCTGMEWVGPPKRIYAGQLSSYLWIVGCLIMVLFAYLIRDWSTFQIVCAAPGVIFWSYWLFYPESPRWLYTQGKIKEMKKLIQNAASVNKVTITDGFFDKLPPPEKEKATIAFFKLFKHKRFACNIFILFFYWFAITLVYYGLALNSDFLSDYYGVHLYFSLQILVDIPGCLAALLLVDRIGRKTVMIGTMLIGGVACIACVFTIVYGGEDSSIATLIFALIGKLAVAAGFKGLYQLTIEIFPTVARNAGFGACSCVARIGGMVAPFVADLDNFVGGNFGKGLPMLVFGGLAGISGCLAFVLPETLNKGLTETIREEIEEERKVLHGDRLTKVLETGEPHLKEPLTEPVENAYTHT